MKICIIHPFKLNHCLDIEQWVKCQQKPWLVNRHTSVYIMAKLF